MRAVVISISLAACGRLSFDAHDAARSPDAPAASCLPDPLTELVYATPAFADFSTTWSIGGSGDWSVANAQLGQSDPTVSLAFAYRDVGLADYRTAVALHAQSESSATRHATELALRIDGANRNMYQCNWEAMTGGLVINATQAGVGTNELARVTVDTSAIDPLNVTLEAQIVGSRIECCVVGIPAAYAAVTDSRFTSGAVGVKTFFVQAAFDHFAVFE